jgi:hypothetical protein
VTKAGCSEDGPGSRPEEVHDADHGSADLGGIDHVAGDDETLSVYA